MISCPKRPWIGVFGGWGLGGGDRSPPWTFPFSACGRVASVNDQQKKNALGRLEVGPVPFFPWGLPTLHVANHLIRSGWTNWNAS